MKRSRSTLFCGLAVILFTAASASAAVVKLGAHGGISIPNLHAKTDNIFTQGFRSRQGPHFGLTAEFDLAPRVSLALALNYTSQGGTRTGMQPITMDLPGGLPIPPDTILWADFRNETILDYLEVPVLARVTFGDKLRVFLDAGPYLGYLVRAEAVTGGASALYLDEAGTMPIIIPPDTEPLEVDLGAETDVMASLKKFNIGLAGGGGVRVPLGPGDLVLEAHFQLGLSTLQRFPETDGQTQTGAILISLGYTLPLGGRK